MPPHHRRGIIALLMGLAGSSAITAFMAAFMSNAGIPITTVLPTSAPIWMGFATMFFMLLNR